MDVATITMTKGQALKKLAAYRDAATRVVDREYQAAYKGYKALSRGQALLNITDAIRDGGFDADLRPNLAICRADYAQVEFRWGWRSRQVTFRGLKHRRTWAVDGGQVIVDMGREHGIKEQWSDVRAYALVPMVPADVRPTGSIERFHVLWEVDNWTSQPQGARPPRDPYLLRHLGGALYAIVAAWDLTDLERAVTEGRGAR